MNETPDGWIERQPEDHGPNHEDACPACDKIQCDCKPEESEKHAFQGRRPRITRADLQTTGEKIPFFRRRLV